MDLPDNRILIAGLGNLLLRDDGVGVHAVRALREDPPENSVPVEVGTAVYDAMPYLARAEYVVALDALDGGRAPGTIYRYTLGEDDARPPGGSLHELDLAATLYMLSVSERPEVLVLGVQPRSLEFGLSLSPEVEAALPPFLEAVRESVRELTARRPLLAQV